MTDPISDMIIRIKNAGNSHKESLSFPYSNLKFEICSLLQKEGFIKSAAKKGKKIAKSIEVELVTEGKLPHIQGVKRVSKPSRRVYRKYDEIRPIKNGYGRLVLSTPKGLLTDISARKQKVGGEALFQIW
jgi:small subunit ribosomal protein S8